MGQEFILDGEKYYYRNGSWLDAHYTRVSSITANMLSRKFNKSNCSAKKNTKYTRRKRTSKYSSDYDRELAYKIWMDRRILAMGCFGG